jgi:hypothetical protein
MLGIEGGWIVAVEKPEDSGVSSPYSGEEDGRVRWMINASFRFKRMDA